jgi:hypothetical protein
MARDRSDFCPVCDRDQGWQAAVKAAFSGIQANRMTGLSPQRLTPLAAVAFAALALAGCNSTTYGTGTSPGMQTIQDLTGLATMGGKQKEPIDYSARPKIVAPPSVAALPPPESDAPPAVANWPNDPDLLRAKVLAEADARNAAGKEVDYRLAKGATTTGAQQVAAVSDRPMTKEEEAKLKQAFADAKGGLAVDKDGNPIRRYLTDPPSEYRLPDPTAPVVTAAEVKKKKKFKWWWQSEDTTEPSAATVPPQTTASP